MGSTEASIFEQFPFWKKALSTSCPGHDAALQVFVGCGTSYYIAQSLATASNAAGKDAIAVPGGEWSNRPGYFCAQPDRTHVIVLSRSGETTETVVAAEQSRSAGAYVTAITAAEGSAITRASDQVLFAETHPDEGIVMTSSASLMLLLGLKMLGYTVSASEVDRAEQLLAATNAMPTERFTQSSHVVFLGSGPLHGIAAEGALKLMEMSQVVTQSFHVLEYRHGPISLVDDQTAVVMLHGADEVESEAALLGELRDKGAYVIGYAGGGDVSFPVDCPPELAGLVILPSLQLLGERMAQARGRDTSAPRHLTKVVMLP